MLINFNTYHSKIIKVFFSSVLIQLIPIVLLPILSRVITKDELGIYMLWQGLASVIVILLNAKFDLAIFVAKSKQESEKLFQLVFLLSTILGPILISISYFFLRYLSFFKKYHNIEKYFFPLILFSISQSIIQSIYSLFIYNSDYKSYNIFRFFQAFVIALFVIITIMVFKNDITYIIYAHSISNFAVLLFLLFQQKKTKLVFNSFKSINELILLLKEHYRFPLYSLPADFINSFSTQLPLLLISTNFGNTYLAYFSMITRVLSAPISLIGNSILTVYKEDAGKEYIINESCNMSFRRAFKLLTLSSLIPFVILFFSFPILFSFIFGPSWFVAGQIAQVMTPLFFFRYISSPLSYTLYITKNQFFDLIWQIILIIVIFLVFEINNTSFNQTIFNYSICYSIMYIVYLYISYKSSFKK